MAQWAVRNRLNGRFDQSFALEHGNAYYLPPEAPSLHSFAVILSPKKYFATHPEYFAMVRGQRQPGSGSSGQICTSNEEVIDILSKQIRQYFQSTPGARCYSICPNDGYGWCECEKCKALDEKLSGSQRWFHRESEPMVSDRLCVFANEIAKRALDGIPGKELYMFAYVNYCPPPQTARPDPRVTHVVCHYIPACYAHAIDTPDCPENRQYAEFLNGWLSISPQAMVYSYTDKSQWLGLPRPVTRQMAADIRFYHRQGVRKYLAQSGASNWSLAGPLYYVTARLLWDVSADPESAIRKWNQAMYGAAAEEMMAWYDAVEAVIVRSGGHYGGDPLREVTNVYSPGCFTEAMRHLSRAVELADTPAAKDRIGRVRQQFEYGMEGVDLICCTRKWEESSDASLLTQARETAAKLLTRKGIWSGTSMLQFRQYVEGVAAVSPQGVVWSGFSKIETKGGRECRNADETGPGDNANGWASFAFVPEDLKRTHRVTVDIWGQSEFSGLSICSRGRGKGSRDGGVWKRLPQSDRVSGKPEWCTLTFTIRPEMLDPAVRRQILGFGGKDSQTWIADVHIEPEP